ncbi:MAG TPA: glutamate--cysteine ligase [Kineosporiaceae bacterium]|nr:glutamate--cysteine ligase [Kineosporiaceae bacterium]
MHVDFCPSAGPTVGVEWELGLIDPATGDLVSAADQVLAAVRPDGAARNPKVHRELMLNTVELVTGVCRGAAEVADDLAATLAEVRRAADQLGIELFCAGSHPFARWVDQRVSDGARYQTLIDRTQWWGRQMLIYGVHVHVGMPSREAALGVLNAMLTFHPHLQALSASSPFWAGIDTGYASNRALMFQQLPTAGLPFQFDSWQQYESYVGDVTATGVIDDVSELRWDLRPSHALGTLEVRVCDGLPTLLEVAALTALTHCLVVDLAERFEGGEHLATLPPWHVQENKWRAARYGTDAIVILDAAGRERLVTEDLLDQLDRLGPVARKLGCEQELAGIEDILRAGASYTRQRAVAGANGGDLRAVIAGLVAELKAGRI